MPLPLVAAESVEIVTSLDQIPPSLKGGVLSIGNFDGVHRGHAQILKRLKEHSAKLGGPAIVFTFDPHPLSLLRPENVPPALTGVPRKLELLAEQGVDGAVLYPTDLKTLSLSAQEFFEQVLLQHFAPRGMVEGPNFHFGKGREGNVERLAAFCAQENMLLEVVSPEVHGEELISSSRIRALIEQGEMAAANELLTAPYQLQGVVEQGAARGRTIGFPTANVGQIETVLPAAGVYAAKAILPSGEAWPAAMNIGPSPTFGDMRRRVEVYLIGFAGDLYGATLRVNVHAKLRAVKAFDSIDALKQQLAEDVRQAREVLKNLVATGAGVKVPVSPT